MQADKLIERKVKARQFDYISFKIYGQKNHLHYCHKQWYFHQIPIERYHQKALEDLKSFNCLTGLHENYFA